MPGAREVYVTSHAITRTRERCPEWAHNRRIADSIFREVSQALEAGRKSKTLPRWSMAPRDMGTRTKGEGGDRFVWNEEETRCYPVKPSKAPNGKRKWVVVTMLQRRADA